MEQKPSKEIIIAQLKKTHNNLVKENYVNITYENSCKNSERTWKENTS